jgi:hypothetical protein
LPYEPAVTAVLSRLRVIVSVFEVTEVKPVPPKMLSVSEPEVIVLLVPESPATSNAVATFATRFVAKVCAAL